MKNLRSKLTLMIILGSLYAFSQQNESEKSQNFFQKGQKMISVSSSISYGNRYGLTGDFGFRYSYLLKDKLSIGLESSFETNGARYRKVDLGPFVRYNFTTTKVSPFLEFKYSYGIGMIQIKSLTSERIKKTPISSFDILGGVTIVGKKQFNIDLFGGYKLSNEKRDGRIRSGIRLSF